MPQGEHTVVVGAPIHKVWEFVAEMDKWAPLVPGYITHEILSDSRSNWIFTGDLGIMKKKIKLQVDITEWLEPEKVTFNLTGLNDNFSGSGFFRAEKITDTTTRMTGFLDIIQNGILAAVVNPVLKSFVPETAAALTEAMGKELTAQIARR
ncbi:CoxG family protein [Peribacillus sp. SCS-155]|uniref:CoxG family protein n=1 Tax=Peribacillus sedimenti TaxID=3115297 RepID=UPI003906D4B3